MRVERRRVSMRQGPGRSERVAGVGRGSIYKKGRTAFRRTGAPLAGNRQDKVCSAALGARREAFGGRS